MWIDRIGNAEIIEAQINKVAALIRTPACSFLGIYLLRCFEYQATDLEKMLIESGEISRTRTKKIKTPQIESILDVVEKPKLVTACKKFNAEAAKGKEQKEINWVEVHDFLELSYEQTNLASKIVDFRGNKSCDPFLIKIKECFSLLPNEEQFISLLPVEKRTKGEQVYPLLAFTKALLERTKFKESIYKELIPKLGSYRRFVQKIVRASGMLYLNIQANLKLDYKIARTAFKTSKNAWIGAPDKLKEDRRFLLSIRTANLVSMICSTSLPNSVISSVEIAMHCARIRPSQFCAFRLDLKNADIAMCVVDVPEGIVNDPPTWLLDAIKTLGIGGLSSSKEEDRALILKYSHLLRFMNEQCRSNKGLMLQVLEREPRSFPFFALTLREDIEVVHLAIHKDIRLLRFAAPTLLQDKNKLLAIVKDYLNLPNKPYAFAQVNGKIKQIENFTSSFSESAAREATTIFATCRFLAQHNFPVELGFCLQELSAPQLFELAKIRPRICLGNHYFFYGSPSFAFRFLEIISEDHEFVVKCLFSRLDQWVYRIKLKNNKVAFNKEKAMFAQCYSKLLYEKFDENLLKNAKNVLQVLGDVESRLLEDIDPYEYHALDFRHPYYKSHHHYPLAQYRLAHREVLSKGLNATASVDILLEAAQQIPEAYDLLIKLQKLSAFSSASIHFPQVFYQFSAPQQESPVDPSVPFHAQGDDSAATLSPLRQEQASFSIALEPEILVDAGPLSTDDEPTPPESPLPLSDDIPLQRAKRLPGMQRANNKRMRRIDPHN